MLSCFSVAPRFTNITGDVNIVANGVNKLRLTCNTDSSNPASTIKWYMNGKIITSTGQMTHSNDSHGGTITSNVYEFAPTREMDGHVVECNATNGISVKDVGSSVTLDLRCKYRLIF